MIDAISLEVLRGRLDAIAQEMLVILLKSSYSTIVTESQDATSAVFDRDGQTVAQSVAIPIHLGVLAELGRSFARTYPQNVARPGDVYVINDPYAGGTHLPDIAIAAPVFDGARLVGYVATMSHHQDVGGTGPGSVAVHPHDHLAEGLRIPMMRLAKANALDEEVLRLFTTNSRTPDNMRGDLMAQIAACAVGVERLQCLSSEWGAARVGEGMDALLDYADRMTRREISSIPEGRYSFTDYLDDDGSGPGAAPVPISVTLTVKGSTLHFDFSGTGGQVTTSLNNVPSSTMSAVYYVVRTLTGESAPNNDGCYRAVTAHIPPGTILNPRFPAPVASRGASLRRVVDALLGAMALAIPERMTAANCGQSSIIPVGTINEHGQRIVATIGGPWMGGSGARATKDGIDVTDHDASNAYHMPIEVSEAVLPMRLRRAELWTDSGGAGKWRGGMGYHVEVEWLRGEGVGTIRRDRHKFKPWGLHGGEGAVFCRTTLARAGQEPQEIPSKGVYTLRPGDRLLMWTTGGGGYGAPFAREPERVLADVLDGRVSVEAAAGVYGVVIREGAVDAAATASRRQTRAP